MANTPAQTESAMKAAIIQAGASKTIYAFVMPETQAALNHVLDQDRTALHTLYDEAWTGKQDSMHREFFDTWLNWSAPVVRLAPSSFLHRYPTAGASEGLREAIHAYGNKARIDGFKPRIHIFDGEYEGYGAYAKAAGIEVVTHDRANWPGTIETIKPTDQIYLSQPSALDGNLWNEYDTFMHALQDKSPKTRLILDLTYVGAVAKPYNIRADYPNIEHIAFSLSKPMGVYYHRIGGMLSRSEMPGLWGNAWFKNLLSLKLGTELLQRHTVHALPKRYTHVQEEAARIVGRNLNINLKLSDVWLLATAAQEKSGEIERFLLRGNTGSSRIRVCLTPTIDRIVKRETSLIAGLAP